MPGRSLREVDSPSLGTPRYHGQIVDADRIEALDASIEGHERVVVVPWGYDAACRVLPWSRDALFVPPGHRGFFHGDLRDRSEWVGGMPTIDTRLTWVQGYPRPDVERPLRMGFDPGTPDSQLRDPDADELLDFYLASPWASELGERGPGAVLELVDWVEARPQLNPGGLLSALIVGVASASATADARAHRPAWTGTWLMEWELSSGRSVRYWLRTEDAPIRTDRIRAYRRATGEPAQPLSLRDRVRSSLEVNGIAVGAWVTEDSLQARRPSAFNPWSPDAPGDVFTWWRRSPYGIPAERGDRAEAGPGGPLRAPIQVWELNHLFEDDPEFLQLRHDWWDYFEAESDAGRAIPVSGRLERGSDGGWTLTAEWDYGGGWVRLTGTRVSDLTFPTRR